MISTLFPLIFFFFHLHVYFLADEQYIYKCPDRLRLPPIFYLGHTASLYVNKLVLAGLIDVSMLSKKLRFSYYLQL